MEMKTGILVWKNTKLKPLIFVKLNREMKQDFFVKITKMLFVGCLASQQHASVSPGRICSDNFTCSRTETEVADQLSTSPSHSILAPGRPVPALTLKTPGACQGSH